MVLYLIQPTISLEMPLPSQGHCRIIGNKQEYDGQQIFTRNLHFNTASSFE
jgi:hypothetical protein